MRAKTHPGGRFIGGTSLRRGASAMVAAAAISAAASAFGLPLAYTGADTGVWFNTNNWNTLTNPGPGDGVSIGAFSPSRGTQVVAVNFNAFNLGGSGLSSLTLDSINCESVDLILNGSGGALNATNEIVGNTVTLNYFDQSAEVNTVSSLTLGNGQLSSGTYNLTGTGSLIANVINVGNSGAGIFNQSGGTSNVSGGLYIGVGVANSNTYILGGTAVLNAASEILAETGTNPGIVDTFSQTGGTNNVALLGNLYVGSNGNAVYNLSGGTINVTGTSNEIVAYGTTSTGTFLQSNGSNNASNLQIGSVNGAASGAGFYNLSGGLLTTTVAQIIGNGTFTQTGGTNNISNSTLSVGTVAGITGTYSLQSGTLNAVNGTEYIGNSSTGTFAQTGGTNFLNFNSAFIVGYTGSSNGSYSLATGSLSISIGGETIGYYGNGIFTQISGSNSISNSTASLTLADNVGSNGTYNLQGGTLYSAGTEYIGFAGTGTFNQSGGTNNTAQLILGFAGAGTYYLQGGNFNVSGNEYVGSSASGTFNQSGGVHTVSGPLAVGYTYSSTYVLSNGTLNALNSEYVGFSGNESSTFTQNGGTNNVYSIMDIGANGGANTGVYILNGGTLNVLGGATEYVGDEGTGVFTQHGGLNNITGNLIVGAATNGYSANSSVYQLYAGTLTAAQGEFISQGAAAIFYQAGGINNANGPGIFVGFNSFKDLFTIVGGTTNATAVTLQASGSLNLAGGTLNTPTLNVNGTPSAFNWTGGTLGLTAGVTFDPAAAPNSTSAAFGIGVTLNSGMSLVVTGNETVGGTYPFTLTLNSGSVDTATGALTVAPAGSLVQNGGPIAQNLSNQGNYYYQGGTFTGQLNNSGTANFSVSGTFSNGIVNTGVVPAVALGVSIIANGTGLNNTGSITLLGGQFNASSAPVSNGGLVTGYGSLIGAPISNSGVITQSGGNLQLNSIGAALNNTGTINLASGLSATITAPSATNDGTINLDSGTLTVSTQLTNNADGEVTGPGKIVGAFVNNGTVEVPNGTTTIGSFTNNGVIEMAGAAAQLGSGATITNAATIEGFGKISDSVTNNSTIQPLAGTLDFTSLVTNAGIINIPASGKVLMQGAAAFPTNAGLINLVGGTFDNGGFPLNNTGSILGYGILSTAGTGLTNNGAITLSGGATTVNGNVTNIANKTINIKYQPAIFTNNLTNNALAVINTISTTFTVAGTFLNNGTYNSDPSTTIFQSNVISGGVINGSVGDQYIFYGGTLTNTGSFLNHGSIQSSDPTTNSGTFTQWGSQNWSVGTAFTNTAGTATFNSDAGGGGANLLITATGGTVTFSTTQHLASLNISSGSTATVTGGGTGHRSVLFTPSLSVTGTLDLTGNDLDVQSGGAAALIAVTGFIKQGFSSGTWTGTGITSSSAAGDSRHLTAVGVVLNTTSTSLDGAVVAVGDVLAKYTYYGDTNLDGKVDGTDYSRIDSAYLADKTNPTAMTGWFNGDFNYDGLVNGSDYTLIDNAFNTQGAQLSAEMATPTAQLAAATGTSVPEPVNVALAIAGVALLSRRVRRQHADRRFKTA